MNNVTSGTFTATDEGTTFVSKVEQIKNNEVYKQVLADSFGGVMYNVSNRGKYNADHILYLWLHLSPAEKESAGGIMKGVFNFLTDKEEF